MCVCVCVFKEQFISIIPIFVFVPYPLFIKVNTKYMDFI